MEWARVFSYLMGDNVEITDTAIFKDTSKELEKHFKIHLMKITLNKTSLELQWKWLLNNFL